MSMPLENPTKLDSEVLEACQKAIDYEFKNLGLLRAALTHASVADTRLESNERMEFLGDAVLGMVVCDVLFERFPEYEEGDLTKIKSAVVSRRTCARLSRQLNLGEFMFLGKGLNAHSNIPSNLLSDVFESLVAAVYLDGGMEAARHFILRYLLPEIEREAAGAQGSNFKSLLQQLAQKDFGHTPHYELLDEQGPDHHKCFKIAAVVGKNTYPSAWGRTKKEAEQRAAMNALAMIHGDPIPFSA